MREAIVEARGIDSPYQTVVKFGDRGLRIHIFWRGDGDPDCHDHPADFWTFPLTSYVEEVAHPWSGGHTEWKLVRAFRLYRRPAEYAHRVLGSWGGVTLDGTPMPELKQRPIVTLVWWGKKRREWGFHTAEGWVHWKDYFK